MSNDTNHAQSTVTVPSAGVQPFVPSPETFNPAASPEATAVWNDVVAPKYAHHERVMVASATEHSDAVWNDIPTSIPHAIDVGCGFGDTSERLARTSQHVTAIDCSSPLLSRAISRHGNVTNLEFVLADAGNYAPRRPAQLCFSRFGLMFFERPVQTLKHLRSWLEPGASFATLVWRSREENPWLELARQAVLEVLPPVDDGAPSCGPGPFSMSEPAVVLAQLRAAGFRSANLEPVDGNANLGASVDEAADFQLALGPAGEIVRHAQKQGHCDLTAARARVCNALAPFVTRHGVVLPSASWWVTARA